MVDKWTSETLKRICSEVTLVVAIEGIKDTQMAHPLSQIFENKLLFTKSAWRASR